MMKRQFGQVFACLFVFFLFATASVNAQQKIKVMVVGGQNNHNWKKSNPYIQYFLDQPDHIDSVINNSPSSNDADEWANWRPRFGDFDVVVLNYNGQMWPEDIRNDFVEYIRNGGNAILVHASNNAFTGWKEFEDMVGLLWRGKDYGTSLYVDDDGNIAKEAPGVGRGMGHGGIFDWFMTTHDKDHPICKGMPPRWMHCRDELYHGQRGPAENINILLTAFSDPQHGGTGKMEPIVWWVPFGKGKVITNVMGHVGEMDCLQCVGFQTIMLRSCEWLAKGECETEIPINFPLVDKVSKQEITAEIQQRIDDSQITRIQKRVFPVEIALTGLPNGLKFFVFEGQWNQLPDFSTMDPVEQGFSDKITHTVTERDENFGLVFKAFLKVEKPGDYRFFTNSDDGSALYLNKTRIVNNDGLHGEQTEGAVIRLMEGAYQLDVHFFEAGGGESLKVFWQQPDGEREEVPKGNLFR